jgi:hypothetical protein
MKLLSSEWRHSKALRVVRVGRLAYKPVSMLITLHRCSNSQVPDEQQVAPWTKWRQPREIPITFAHEPASQFHRTGRRGLE